MTMGVFLPGRLLLVRGPRRRARITKRLFDFGTEKQELALTFDDGPHPEWTPTILERLKEHNMRATFFVIGRNAQRYPNLVRQIVADGHDVGNHTLTHGDPCATTARQLLYEVSHAQYLLHSLTGKDYRVMRPPKGDVTAMKLVTLWWQGYTVVLWNVDPGDYRAQSAEALRRWCGSYVPRSGDIVLLHDRCPYSLEVIDRLGEIGKERKLTFVSVSQWLCR